MRLRVPQFSDSGIDAVFFSEVVELKRGVINQRPDGAVAAGFAGTGLQDEIVFIDGLFPGPRTRVNYLRDGFLCGAAICF